MYIFIQACKGLQYKLPMKQEAPMDELEIMKEINQVITTIIGSPKGLQELKSGAVYLQMVATVHPNAITMSSINFAASSLWEYFQNFTILSQLMKAKGFPFTFDIQKLAQTNLSEHFRFSAFLFHALRQPTWTRLLKNKRISGGHREICSQIVLSPQKLPFRPSINLSSYSNSQIQGISEEKQLDEFISDEIKSCSKNIIIMNLMKAKELNESYMNTFKIRQESRLNFYSFIRHITLQFLNSKQSAPLSWEQKQAINDCLSVHKSFRSIQYLFYGKSDMAQDEQMALAHAAIRKSCCDYYQSIGFIHEIVNNQLRKMKFKIMQIAYLHKLQLFTQRKLSRKQFECADSSELVVYFQSEVYEEDAQMRSDFAFSAKKISQIALCESKNVKDSSMIEVQTKEQANTFDDVHYIQTSNENNCEKRQSQKYSEETAEKGQGVQLSFSRGCSDQLQYWTIHRITMIAYELQYIHHKDPDYIEDDEFFYKRSDHTKFVTGLLFTCLCENKKGNGKNKPQEDVKTLIKSQKYPNLTRLFRKKEGTDEGDARLGEFVRILLSLKHDAVLYEFACVYDSIVAEVQSVTFAEVKGRQNRFAFVERVTEKLRQSAAEIDGVLREMLSLEEGSENAIVLLRTSVYCLLAERFAFHTNELWPVAFPQQKIQMKPKKVQNNASAS